MENGTSDKYFRLTNGNPEASDDPHDDPHDDPPPRDREPAFRRGGGSEGSGQGGGERVFLLVASAISAAVFWIIA
tara:strand:+ start:923 stop:1147 length:225 start_codon:yes stop_codon:yes gene_type:complete